MVRTITSVMIIRTICGKKYRYKKVTTDLSNGRRCVFFYDFYKKVGYMYFSLVIVLQFYIGNEYYVKKYCTKIKLFDFCNAFVINLGLIYSE